MKIVLMAGMVLTTMGLIYLCYLVRELKKSLPASLLESAKRQEQMMETLRRIQTVQSPVLQQCHTNGPKWTNAQRKAQSEKKKEYWDKVREKRAAQATAQKNVTLQQNLG